LWELKSQPQSSLYEEIWKYLWAKGLRSKAPDEKRAARK